MNRDSLAFPSPGSYNIETRLEANMHFPKGPRSDMAKESKVPGVGTYELTDKKDSILGTISRPTMAPQREKIETPAPNTYSPRHDLTERRGQDSLIRLTSGRTDFAKSPTSNLGPGAYDIIKKFEQELGLMCSRTERLKNRPNESVACM